MANRAQERRNWFRRQYNKAKKYSVDTMDGLVKAYTEESDDTEALSAPHLPNPGSSAAMGAIGVVTKGLKVLLLPIIKSWETWKYFQIPEEERHKAKKPTLTRKEIVYFLVDITLLGLSIAGIVLLNTMAGGIIGVVAAAICGGAAIYQQANYWKKLKNIETQVIAKQTELKTKIDELTRLHKDPNTNEEVFRLESEIDNLMKDYNKLKNDQYASTKRMLNLTFTSLYIASAALILAGILLSPVGFPVVAAGVALAATVSAIGLIMYGVDVIKKRMEKNLDENPEKYKDKKLYKLVKGNTNTPSPDFDNDEGIELQDMSQKTKGKSADPSAKPADLGTDLDTMNNDSDSRSSRTFGRGSNRTG